MQDELIPSTGTRIPIYRDVVCLRKNVNDDSTRRNNKIYCLWPCGVPVADSLSVTLINKLD